MGKKSPDGSSSEKYPSKFAGYCIFLAKVQVYHDPKVPGFCS